MSRQKVNNFLYRTRIFFAAAALLFILYGVVFLWFRVPYGSPLFQWQADAHLVVEDAPEQIADLLQPGDIVLAIGGQAPVRGRPLYPQPLAVEYDFTIVRNGETLTVSVPVYAPISLKIASFLLPPTLLALAGWFVGAVMLFWAHQDNLQALQAGYIFLLAAVVLIGLQGALDGVPGAWVAHSLIFILAVCWVYLGTLPRPSPLPPWARHLFLLLFTLAGLLGLAMAYEALFLLPRFTSVQGLVGISLYKLGLLLSSLGLLVCVLLLAWRAVRLPRPSYMRQQLTLLLVFFAIGVFPAIFLTIIPRAMFDAVLLPFTAAITLMVFIPAGYLFVIYRKGMLGLDPFFSRTIYLAILSLFVFGFYAAGLYLALRWLNLDGAAAMAPATIIFFPTLLLTIYANKPVHAFVQRLVYGNGRICEESLSEITVALSARPEPATLARIVDTLVAALAIPQAMLLVKNEAGYPVLAASVGLDTPMPPLNSTLAGATKPILRSAARLPQKAGEAFQNFSWAELFVPIVARNKQIGLLVLARPGNDGFFNAHQISFLTQAANVLAVGSENITLFETARFLSRQALVVREQERKQLAARIHDDPLQIITYAAHELERVNSFVPAGQVNPGPDQITPVVVHLRSAATKLRHICQGLYPPFWDQGVELAVREIVRQFQVEHKLNVQLTIEGQGHDNASEEVTASTCHILTESLNNVVKHGAGAAAKVTLNWTAQSVTLRISDNGPGSADVTLPYSDLLRRHHFGIVGMYEWARLVNGELRIELIEPSGVSLFFICSLHKQAPLPLV